MEESRFAHMVLASEHAKRRAQKLGFRRYLYPTVARAPESYYVGISGLRGIGKTVLMTQIAAGQKHSLYFQADATYLNDHSVYEVVSEASSRGYSSFFIDEIHYKREWQQDLKTLYDEGVGGVFFSGSSAIELHKGADLSRRAVLFRMKPLSYREFLFFRKGKKLLDRLSASELFDSGTRKKAIEASAGCEPHVQEYMRTGGVLYDSSEPEFFSMAVENTLEKIIRTDLADIRAIDGNAISDIRKILLHTALSPAGEVSYSSLASRTAVTKPTVIRIIDDLVRLGIIARVLPCGKRQVRKEPKLYIAPPFRAFLCDSALARADLGTLREEFFIAHAGEVCYVKGYRGEKTPDFMLEGKKLEIGGDGKGWKQDPDFIVRDGLTLAEKEIPLYLTGFLY